MQNATYTTIDFCKVGSCAWLKGVQHPNGIGPDVVTTPVRSYDPSTGVIETFGTRYTRCTKASAPAKLYKPTHGGYPG